MTRAAGRRAPPAARIGRVADHLPSPDPGAQGRARAEVALELAGDPGERLAHAGRGPQRPHRVVLVQDRQAEGGHDDVAGLRLDGGAVALENAAQHGLAARHEPPAGLGVERRRVRVAEAGEDDGHGLAAAGRGRPLRGGRGRGRGRSAKTRSGRVSPGRT